MVSRLLSLSLLFSGLLALASAGPAAASSWYESGRVQLQLAPGAWISEINARYGTTTVDSLPPLYLLSVPPGMEEEFILQMTGDPEIVEVEYSYTDNTPEAVRQMVVAAVGGTIDDYLDQGFVGRLHLLEAQEHTRGDGVIVAVLDTGVRSDHPALQGCLLDSGYDFVEEDSIPEDTANGIDDDFDGETDEGAGHGTMVCGIAHLVAPNAWILPIRVLDDEGNGISFDVAKGLRYAREHGAQVINLSLGLGSSCGIIGFELRAARDSGIILVSAAGNDGQEGGLYPASDSKVLMVAALDSADVKADFSNYSSQVDLSAPGVGILAPFYDGEYAIGAGTSFSVPFISGQCALIRSLNPALSWEEIMDVVPLGVVEIYQIPENAPYIGKLGSGRFDAWETFLTTPASAGAPGGAAEVAAPGLAGLQIRPNPARAGARIGIEWSGTAAPGPNSGAGAQIGSWTASVFSPAGRLVARIGPGWRPHAPGSSSSSHGSGSLFWDGRDAEGRPCPPGVYFVRASAGPEAAADGSSAAPLRTVSPVGRLVLIR